MTTLYENTKLCCSLFTGCDNAYCSYAHSLSEIRWGLEYAMEDVYFKKPEGARSHSTLRGQMPEPDETNFPSFIVSLSDDDDDDDFPPASMSLVQMNTIASAWQLKKMKEAYWTRLWTLEKEFQRLTDHMGEMDMDLSE